MSLASSQQHHIPPNVRRNYNISIKSIMKISHILTNKFILVIFLISACLNSFSQDIVKKSISLGPGLREVFYVLKSDKSTRHGEYSLILNKDTIQKGFYCNGKKSGIWIYPGDAEKGFTYSFDSCSVLSDTIGKDRNALYSEGYMYFQYLLYSNLQYPIEAAEAGLQGKVIIEFTIDTEGCPKDFLLKIGCGSLILNDEAMRVVKQTVLANPWYPAINDRGEKVKSTLEREVNFRVIEK